MGSRPTSELASELRFLTRLGEPQDSFPEWTPGFVEIPVGEDHWRHVEMRVNGQPRPVSLRVIGDKAAVVADWDRAGPGWYEIRVRTPFGEITRRVQILPAKISPDAYRTLLDDLDQRLPAAVALALHRAGALGGFRLNPPRPSTLGEEVARLRRAVRGRPNRPGLAAVLAQLADDPHRMLHTRHPWTLRDRARRPQPAGLARALARSGNLAGDGIPVQVLDSRVEHTVDIYENRLVKLFHHEVDARLRGLRRSLSKRDGDNSLAAELAELAAELASARRRARFLDEVTLATMLPDRLTMVLLNVGPYRAAYEGWSEFRRSASVVLEDPTLDSPLENLPHLYEVWGTLVVIDQLLETGIELGYHVDRQRIVRRIRGLLCVEVLPAGAPALILRREDGASVRLWPQRSFGTGQSGYRSISFTQVPDISIEVSDPARKSALYLLDPKYKLVSEEIGDGEQGGTPKKVDIDKMHAYRDAIRDTDGRPIVRYAATLYPGITCTYSEGLEAVRAYPGDEGSLRDHLKSRFRTWLERP